MAKIRWTTEAATWLEDIYRYIALDNPDSAHDVVSGIYGRVQGLARFPRLGYVFREGQAAEVRIILYGHYRIAYRMDSDDIVTVLGIFHAALDIDRYL